MVEIPKTLDKKFYNRRTKLKDVEDAMLKESKYWRNGKTRRSIMLATRHALNELTRGFDMNFEIYFNDLNEETKKELLKFYNLKKAEDGNFDNCPIAILEVEKE